jgi:hypothetical protein
MFLKITMMKFQVPSQQEISLSEEKIASAEELHYVISQFYQSVIKYLALSLVDILSIFW